MNALSQALQESKTYLASPEAMASIERDPYWPKWDSPWWHMMLLFELDLALEIPAGAVEKMVATLKTHYLPIFPIKPEEVPEGTDPHRQIACICAIGNIYQALFACGVDVDRELPWMREWFLRYQLPDGGLNCDERVYTKPVPKSSIVSTIACLEAVLFCRNRELTAAEAEFLDRGARYLLRQKLFRKVSTGEVIDDDWLEIRFPRFYEYDFLRGFYFLRKWQQASGFQIPDDLVDEVEQLAEKQWDGKSILLKRYNLFDKRSLNPQADGSWARGQATEFTLMKAVSYPGAACPALTKKWTDVRPETATVLKSYETVYKNPIKLEVGESVKIEKRETAHEWIGWVYCIDQRGIGGWVSEKYLKESEHSAQVVKKYDATELTAGADEQLTIYYEEFGWCWCRNAKNLKGWIPAKHLSIPTRRLS